MKQILKSINPKQIFRFNSKKQPKSPPSLSKSSPPSFNSTSSASTTSSSSSDASSSSHCGLKAHRSVAAPVRTRSEELTLRSDELTADPLRFDVVQAFKMIDRDGDGKITRFELESLFKRVVGTTDEELGEMIKEIDRDGDGCISLEELTAVGFVFDSNGEDVPEDELRGAFDFFDADHDGKIDGEELYQGFIALGEERYTLADCRRMIEGVDENKDGFVCFQDFSRMMMHNVIPR